ncbi:MAG: APC family permease [Kosmotogaceae bacterium]
MKVKTLGLVDLIALEVGMTIGAGVFTFLPLAASKTGNGTILALVFAAVPMLFILLNLMILGSILPTTGGTFKYGAYLFSPVVSFVGVWLYLFGAFVGFFPLTALTLSKYIQTLWSQTPLIPFAIAVLTVFYLINLFGIKIASRIEVVFVITLFASLLIYIFSGFHSIDPSNLEGIFSHELNNVFYSAALLTFIFLGSNAVLEVGGDIKNAKRNMPVSVVISFITVLAVYLAISFVTFGVASADVSASGTLNNVASRFLKGFLYYFFTFGGPILAIVTTINATYMWGSRSLIALSKMSIIPTRFSRQNRWGTPYILITGIWLISCFSLIVLGEGGLEVFGLFASIGGIAILIPSILALTRINRFSELRGLVPNYVKKKWFVVMPWLGVLFSAIIFILLIYQLLTEHNLYYLIGLFIWVTLGFVYIKIRRKHLQSKNKDPFEKEISSDLFIEE